MEKRTKIYRGVPKEPRNLEIRAMKKCDLSDVLICATSFQKHVWADGVAMCTVSPPPSLMDRLKDRVRFTEICWAEMAEFKPLVEVPHAQQSFPVCNANNIPGIKKLARWLKEQETRE